MVAAREQLKGRIADLEAQSAALADLPNGATDAELSRDQTELLTLQTAADLSADNQAEVEKEYRAALLGGTRASSELTRIGTASLPTYPDEPKRILYLALGLLFGALAGVPHLASPPHPGAGRARRSGRPRCRRVGRRPAVGDR